MHELGVMERVLEMAVDFAWQHEAVKITKIHLTAGTLANIIPKWGKLFFSMIAKDTIAEGAELVFTVLPASILCRSCGQETKFFSDDMTFHCGRCGSEEVSLVSGKEFTVSHIEVIVSDQKEEENGTSENHPGERKRAGQ